MDRIFRQSVFERDVCNQSCSHQEVTMSTAVTRAGFLAFGTRGDVQPLLALCLGYAKQHPSASCVLSTHSCHLSQWMAPFLLEHQHYAVQHAVSSATGVLVVDGESDPMAV